MVKLPLHNGDPLLTVGIRNFYKNTRKEVLAYLDTGADVVALSRDVWEELEIEPAGIISIGVVGGISNVYYSYVDVEILGKTFKEVSAVYQEYGDVLIGREILDNFDYCIKNSSGALDIRPIKPTGQRT